jgi:hypothetical protein
MSSSARDTGTAAGNTPSGATYLWSALSLITLLGGIGTILFLFGRFDYLGWHQASTAGHSHDNRLLAWTWTPSQRATAWYLAVVAVLFLAQTLLGGVIAHDRVEPGAREVAVRAGDLGAPVHQKDDVRGSLQRHFGLLENLCRNILGIVRHDPAGIDHLEAPAVVFGHTVNPVARDARLIADDRPPLSRDPVEEGGFADVGPAHDHYGGGFLRHLFNHHNIFLDFESVFPVL